MAHDQQAAAPVAAEQQGVVDRAGDLGDYWVVVLAYGLVTFGLGVVLAVWPGETLVVVAVLVSVQLVVTGAVRLATALTSRVLDGGARALAGLHGALALIVGLLLLRDPLQTVVLMGLVLGAWWLAGGLLEIVEAVLSPGSRRRGWGVAMGAVSALVGAFLLVNPKASLGLLVVVVCVWLLGYGFFAIIEAVYLRSGRGTSLAPTSSVLGT